MTKPKPDEHYRHFKGGLYRVVAIGKHSETEEPMVCYVREGMGMTSVWVRPLSMWDEVVEHEGKHVKRFTKIIPTGYPIGASY